VVPRHPHRLRLRDGLDDGGCAHRTETRVRIFFEQNICNKGLRPRGVIGAKREKTASQKTCGEKFPKEKSLQFSFSVFSFFKNPAVN
jgi:hypothetical protein